MIQNIANFVVWVLIAVSIVVFGWNEPLRYHFISAERVQREERALMPPNAAPDYRSWRGKYPGASSLEHHGLNETPIPRR